MWITLCALTAAVVVLGMFCWSRRSRRSQAHSSEGLHEEREEENALC